MRKTLALLVASTALTATLGFAAWSATRESPRPVAALSEDGTPALPLILISDDDDDDDRKGLWGHDDDDCGDDDDDDDDDGGCRGGARNPAPAGSKLPPQNGLFGTGAPPQVQVN
ncbi:hypothetical protein [Frigidibacter mobilis]|uniref:Secreted protein n=1 Tax=Frigidibacter mobilis TaxID=1335048 RepID=A0A159Z998_9RHOB|nr:hypothetical protein [Frigidibacter mobilis]AMY71330.1 hypothetical protein AKL17_4108 [Frigidibacter mobilis]